MAKDDDGPGMSAAELKPLLRLARRRPVTCAVAMLRDRSGVVLLDRRKKPRKMLGDIRRVGGSEIDPTSIRFGRASVGGTSDAAKVTFTVNKAAPASLRTALLPKLRAAGFQQCELVWDTALESEPEDGEDPADDDGDEAAAPDEEAEPAAGAAPQAGIDTEAGVASPVASGRCDRSCASGGAKQSSGD